MAYFDCMADELTAHYTRRRPHSAGCGEQAKFFVRRRLFIALAVFGAMLAAVVLVRRERTQIVHQGKTLREWLLQVYAPDTGGQQQVTEALHAFGSNAVPDLIKSLKARDPLLRRTAE